MQDKRTKPNLERFNQANGQNTGLFLEFMLTANMGEQHYICHLAKVNNVMGVGFTKPSPNPMVNFADHRQGSIPVFHLTNPLNTQYAPKPSTQTAILFHDRQTFFGIFVNHVARTRFLRWDMIESWFDQAHYACGVFFHKDESLWLLDLDAIYLYLFTNYPSDILLSLKPTQQESIHTNPHCHIAIIDDSSCQRRILSNALSQHAFESKSFNSGTDFLKAQKDEWTPYAAIIIDVEMPRVSGIELEKILRSDSRYHATPMIFWTSISDKYLERQDLKARRTYFVAKFDLETLIKTIQTCVTIPLLQAHP